MPVYIPVPRVTFGRTVRPHPVIFARGGLAGLGAVQLLDPGVTQTIAGAIQRQEGWYPGSVAYQNNNPGNLIYAGQAGATAGPGGFAQFGSYQAGLDALQNQLQLYAARGLTIQEMMDVYAPASQPGNNPVAYASNVAGALGVSPDTRLLDLGGDIVGSGGGGLPAVAAGSSFSFLDSDPVLLGVGAGALGLLLWAALG